MLPVAIPHTAPLLTPKALCVQLSICPRTYSRLVRAGMPHVLVLTARRYDLVEVTAWLRRRSPSVVEAPRPRRMPRPRMSARHDSEMVRHLKLLARAGR